MEGAFPFETFSGIFLGSTVTTDALVEARDPYTYTLTAADAPLANTERSALLFVFSFFSFAAFNFRLKRPYFNFNLNLSQVWQVYPLVLSTHCHYLLFHFFHCIVRGSEARGWRHAIERVLKKSVEESADFCVFSVFRNRAQTPTHTPFAITPSLEAMIWILLLHQEKFSFSFE